MPDIFDRVADSTIRRVKGSTALDLGEGDGDIFDVVAERAIQATQMPGRREWQGLPADRADVSDTSLYGNFQDALGDSADSLGEGIKAGVRNSIIPSAVAGMENMSGPEIQRALAISNAMGPAAGMAGAMVSPGYRQGTETLRETTLDTAKRSGRGDPNSLAYQGGEFAGTVLGDLPVLAAQPEVGAVRAGQLGVRLGQKFGSEFAERVTAFLAKNGMNVPIDVVAGGIDRLAKSGELPSLEDTPMDAAIAFTARNLLGLLGRRRPQSGPQAEPRADVPSIDEGALRSGGPLPEVRRQRALAAPTTLAGDEGVISPRATPEMTRGEAARRSQLGLDEINIGETRRADAMLRQAAREAVETPGNIETVTDRSFRDRASQSAEEAWRRTHQRALPPPSMGNRVFVPDETGTFIETIAPDDEMRSLTSQRPYTANRNAIDIVRNMDPQKMKSAVNVVAELAAEQGIPKGAAAKQLKGLVDNGVLVRVEGGGFDFGNAPAFLPEDDSTAFQALRRRGVSAEDATTLLNLRGTTPQRSGGYEIRDGGFPPNRRGGLIDDVGSRAEARNARAQAEIPQYREMADLAETVTGAMRRAGMKVPESIESIAGDYRTYGGGAPRGRQVSTDEFIDSLPSEAGTPERGHFEPLSDAEADAIGLGRSRGVEGAAVPAWRDQLIERRGEGPVDGSGAPVIRPPSGPPRIPPSGGMRDGGELIAPPTEQKRVGFLSRNFEPMVRVLETMNESGRRVAERIYGIERTAAQLAGPALDSFERVVSRLKPKQAEEFISALNGEISPASIADAKVAKLAAEHRAYLDEMHDAATRAGIQERYEDGSIGPLRYRPDFFPSSFVRDDAGTYMFDLAKRPGTYAGSLHHARMGEARGTLDDLARYYRSAGRDIAETAVLGPDKSTAIQVFAAEIGEAGGDYEYAKEALTEILGGGRRYSDAEIALTQGIKAAQTATKLPIAVLANATQTAMTFSQTNMSSVAKAIKELAQKSTRPGVMELFASSGGSVDSILMHAVERPDTLVGKAANGVLNVSGFNAVERFNRIVAASAGANYADQLYAAVRAASMGGKQSVRVDWFGKAFPIQAAKADLRRMGVDVQGELAVGAARLSEQSRMNAAYYMVGATQFSHSRSQLPLTWVRSPWTSVLTQFKTFALKQSWTIADKLVKPAMQGNVAPLAKFIVAGGAATYAQALVRQKLFARDDSSLTVAVDSITALLMLDQLSRIYTGTRYGSGIEAVAGPAVGDASQVATLVGRAGAYGIDRLQGDATPRQEKELRRTAVRTLNQVVPISRAITKRINN